MKSKIYIIAFLVFAMPNLCLAQYTKLLDMDNTATGIYPYYGALYSDGTFLYGTTTNGGLNGDGTIFKIKSDGTAFSKLLDFDETVTGSIGESSLISDGTYLYGTARKGGTSGDGTVFKIKPDGTGFTKIHDFAGEELGRDPHGSLYDDGIFLYGMTGQGGADGVGTIYKLQKDGSDFSIVFNFEFWDFALTGNSPYGSLITDGTYLYGMTVGGGVVNQGVVFKIKPDGTGFLKLLDFTDDPNGSWGYGSLVYDGTYLYGMTNNGGEYNRGTIFKVKTDGTNYEKLLDLDNSNGAQPLGSLILVGTTLYGMTELGGEDNDAQGNMFSIETDGSNFTTLIDFDGDNGSTPYGTLLYEDGAFFGM
ncbi:MAG: choice-of-anchor tandem repeat GloVer-containing protein, partial [Chitinophagales bacterium]